LLNANNVDFRIDYRYLFSEKKRSEKYERAQIHGKYSGSRSIK